MRSGRRVLLAALAIVIAMALVISALVLVPHWLVPGGVLTGSDRIRLLGQSSIRSTILQLLGGLVVVVGIAYTAVQVKISRETHYTERYAKAIDQLGHPEKIVRVGGMFALRRLAANSAVDGPVVVEVLRSYLKVVSPRLLTSSPPPGPGQISPDIQTALTLLIELYADGA